MRIKLGMLRRVIKEHVVGVQRDSSDEEDDDAYGEEESPEWRRRYNRSPENEVLGMLSPELEVDEQVRAEGGHLVVIPSDWDWDEFQPGASDRGKAYVIAHAVEEIMVDELGYIEDPDQAPGPALKMFRPDDGAHFTISMLPSTNGAVRRGHGNVGVDLIYTGRWTPLTSGT